MPGTCRKKMSTAKVKEKAGGSSPRDENHSLALAGLVSGLLVLGAICVLFVGLLSQEHLGHQPEPVSPKPVANHTQGPGQGTNISNSQGPIQGGVPTRPSQAEGAVQGGDSREHVQGGDSRRPGQDRNSVKPGQAEVPFQATPPLDTASNETSESLPSSTLGSAFSADQLTSPSLFSPALSVDFDDADNYNEEPWLLRGKPIHLAKTCKTVLVLEGETALFVNLRTAEFPLSAQSTHYNSETTTNDRFVSCDGPNEKQDIYLVPGGVALRSTSYKQAGMYTLTVSYRSHYVRSCYCLVVWPQMPTPFVGVQSVSLEQRMCTVRFFCAVRNLPGLLLTLEGKYAFLEVTLDETRTETYTHLFVRMTLFQHESASVFCLAKGPYGVDASETLFLRSVCRREEYRLSWRRQGHQRLLDENTQGKCGEHLENKPSPEDLARGRACQVLLFLAIVFSASFALALLESTLLSTWRARRIRRSFDL
ncbi:TPA_asm: MC161R [Molluscum contagiosum virus]|nr:MC161 [Molluscum contagiosum virus subtype 1]DBA37423.1 TPA_asm: MC161R [Molluscum contagiosum virus]DBA37603.1 TPA_asm: MC161R [Molluscum contagiosum virus]DBA37783.1 TPA_asm: MC161R [Molluscum contagiosum virus]DBA38500.1 TPA_asm: MC161R [Molluscum contagiosum virus]